MEGGKITQTEWARELGVSKQYVCYLVKKGIVELEDGLIDREQANEAVAAIRDPSQPLRRKIQKVKKWEIINFP